MLKKIFTLLIVFASMLSFAQAPDLMNYQAVIRDSNGDIVSDQQVGLRLSILKGSAGGASVHQGEYAPSTDEFGVISVQIGNPISVIGDMSTIDWGETTYYLKTEIDIAGGSNYVEMGTTQFLSVPYALHANSADTADYAKSIGSIDDADADPTNEIQNLRLVEDTLFLSGSNYVLLGGLNEYFCDSYGTDTMTWWYSGTYANWDTPGIVGETAGHPISISDWKTIFEEVGYSLTTSSNKTFPEDRDVSILNIKRHTYYQPTNKEMYVEFAIPGTVTDAAAELASLTNSVMAMKKFSLKVYKDEILVKEFTKDDFDPLLFVYSGNTYVYLKFNGELPVEKNGFFPHNFSGVRYEMCIKK
tara:strand:- start:27 stop:1103 length:1077 start_codon:yes stop_codon:yes gene_type:complete